MVYRITIEFQEQKHTFSSIHKQFYLLENHMANETGGLGMDGLNIGWEVREDTNKVTEEAVRRVQDDQKKAQQVGQQIQQDKSTNNKFAAFLGFLLSDIKNDTLMKQIYHTFFKTYNEETALNHIRKSTNTIVIVGMFAPFYPTYIKELELESIYQDIWNFDEDIYLTKYIGYIKQLLPKHHDNINIDKNEFTTLLKLIAEYYQLTEKLSPEQSIEFAATLKKELALQE